MSEFKLLPRFLHSRIALVWAITLVMTGLLMSLWYVLQPSLIYMANQMEAQMDAQGISSTESGNIFTLIRFVVNIFIPILIIGLWIWALSHSQQKEWRGYYEQA